MDAKPHVYPPVDMWTFFQNTAKNFNELGGQILYRHGDRIDPIVYKLIYNISESGFITSCRDSMISMRNVDIEHNWPRPKVLSCYSLIPSQETLDSILFLYNWCVEIKVSIDKDFNLPDLYQYETSKDIEHNCAFRKNPLELEKEIETWNKFISKT